MITGRKEISVVRKEKYDVAKYTSETSRTLYLIYALLLFSYNHLL